MADPFPSDLASQVDRTPASTRSVYYRLDVSTTDASIALPTGGYQVLNDGSSTVVCCFDATATNPASGASVAASFVVSAGGVASFTVDAGGQTLHAITLTGTSTLRIGRFS